MRGAARIVAVALAVICLCLAMPIVAGWSMPAEQVWPAPPINPLELMEQAGHLQAQQNHGFLDDLLTQERKDGPARNLPVEGRQVESRQGAPR